MTDTQPGGQTAERDGSMPAAGQRRRLVLVVDDDPTVRMLARLTLEEQGLAVAEAEDGPTALETFAQLRPDLVLLDVHMPTVDGYTVCGLLRKSPEGAHVPILIMTAAEDVDGIRRAFDVGATDFLTKPLHWVLLGYRVRYALRDSARILLEVARTVSSTLELPEVLRRMTRECVRLVDADAGGAWLVDSQKQILSPVAGYRVPKNVLESFREAASSAAGDLAGLAEELGGPLFIEDSQGDPRCAHPLFRLVSHGSLLVLPLRARGSTRAAVVVAWLDRRVHLTPEEVRLSMAVAHQTEVAIENALLLREIRAGEDQLRQAQKLEAIGRLAGGIAHDFNNLMAVSLIQSERLLRDFPDDDPRRKRAEDLVEIAQRASELTRRLLVFSRRQLVQPSVIDLNSVVAGLARLLDRVLGEDVPLSVEACAEPCFIVADPGQIEQVIMNLVINARDAMPQGGRLVVGTRAVQVGAELAARRHGMRAGAYVVLSVIDTGTGMDEATQSHLFEPFFTTKEPGKGTGLGLSTVYGIVTQAGGFIDVRSALGQGSTFEVFLPRSDRTQKDIPCPVDRQPALPRGGEVVLLVEDQEPLRRLIAEALDESGYVVLSASNGAEALDRGKRAPTIDLLLSDVVMPGMNGLELADRLKPRFTGMRILYMSGYVEGDSVGQAISRMGTSVLQKPFALQDLVSRVREVLDGASPGAG